MKSLQNAIKTSSTQNFYKNCTTALAFIHKWLLFIWKIFLNENSESDY